MKYLALLNKNLQMSLKQYPMEISIKHGMSLQVKKLY